MKTHKTTKLLIILSTVLLATTFMGCSPREELQCDSKSTLDALHSIAVDSNIKIEFIDSFATVESSDNKTLCKALYKTSDLSEPEIVNYTITETDSGDFLLETI